MSTLRVTTVTSPDANTDLILASGNNQSGQILISANGAGVTLKANSTVNAITINTTSWTFSNNPVFSTNTFTVGTAAYFVANGNVGIGNSTPNYKFVVDGIVGGANSRFAVGSGLSAAAPDYSFAADGSMGMFRLPGVLGFSTTGAERMRIDNSGRLLVGKTSALGYKLETAGGTWFSFSGSTATDSYGEFRNGNTILGLIGAGAGGAISGGSGTDLALRAESNLLFATNGNTERMRIDGNGRVTTQNQPAFIAYAGASRFNQTGTLTFNNVTQNVGNHYNGSTTFTAPVTGWYIFTGQFYKESGTEVGVYLLVNGVGQTEVYRFVGTGATSSGHCATSWSMVLRLAANDTVLLSVVTGQVHQNPGLSYFSGRLLG